VDNVVLLSTLPRETLLPLESSLYDVRFRPKADIASPTPQCAGLL
jgi:hypothetical protein